MDVIRLGFAALALLALLPILWQVVTRWQRARNRATGRVLAFVAIVAISAVLVSVALLVAFPESQQFAAFGISKKVTLPIGYVAAVIVLTLPGARGRPALRLPLFWVSMWILLIVGFAHTFFWPSQPPLLSATAQGTLLFAGFLIFFLVGATTGHWQDQDVSVFLLLLCAVTVIAIYANTSLASLVALTTPLGFGLVLWSRQARHNRAAWLIVGLAFAGWNSIFLLTDPDSSVASVSQLGVCAALLLLAVLPRPVRLLIWLLALPSAAIGLVLSPIWPLMLGQWRHESDVTLAQRGFETSAVIDLIHQSSVSTFLGMGPGGYVNLTGSPDARTLVAAGRHLHAVDDVHLLTSWLLLKGGILGLSAFLGFIVFLVVMTFKHLGARAPSAFDTLLLMLTWAGVAMALPAATHAFANPLPALAAGLLFVRLRARPTEISPPAQPVDGRDQRTRMEATPTRL